MFLLMSKDGSMTANGSVSRDLSDRLDFVGLGKAERDALRQAKTGITPSLDSALDTFYKKATVHPVTSTFFSSDAHVKSAKSRQAKHWETIAGADFDAGYVEAV